MRRRVAVSAGVVALAAALSVPGPATETAPAGDPTPFRWDSDALFASLEEEFTRSAGLSREAAEVTLATLREEGRALLAGVAAAETFPREELERLALLQFEMAVPAAAHPDLLPRLGAFLVEARVTVMRAAAPWPRDRSTHESLYRVLFGGRMALDEALIQAGEDAVQPLVRIEDIPSATPFIEVEGVRVHSGDILLSRGGAPTSALIARGSDFPNSFSHAALVHVDPETGTGTVVEALIEKGSVTTTVEDFLSDKRYRLVLLRVPPEHPALVSDPMLPHRAAETMLARVRSGHIPYDFSMHWDDRSALFCSEVVFHAYQDEGLDLWAFRSSMTAPGLVAWLGSMGVEEFTTLVPSDLEYDPRVRAVVEWRNAPALMDYRLDNAVTDVLLEEADRGGRLGYPWYLLAPARTLKAYSAAQSSLGRVPVIPEGMGPATALRVESLVTGVAPALKENLVERAAAFRETRGYEPPYWELVSLARESLDELRESLPPRLQPGAGLHRGPAD